jgi:hypothetical protein
LRRHRLAEIIALRLLAAGAEQEAHLCVGLHALGNDLLPKLVGKPDGSPNHGGVAIIDGDLQDEFLRELQPVDRVLGEIFE